MGRLFDAVASFANILHIQTYEGETGLQIEKIMINLFLKVIVMK